MTHTEYLENLARNFPERDHRGYIIGHYVYGTGVNGGRLTDAFPTRAEAEADEAVAPLIKAGNAKIVVGHVFTAKGRIVQVVQADDDRPAPIAVEA